MDSAPTEPALLTFRPGERPDLFWMLAGPVFGDRSAQRDLGGPFTDDPHTSWVLAVRDQTLLGLASLRVEAGRGLLDHAYVRPPFRRQGVHGLLVDARLALAAELGAATVRVLANDRAFPRYLKLGFIGIGARGHSTLMEAETLLLAPA